jgi:hypothetical protein
VGPGTRRPPLGTARMGASPGRRARRDLPRHRRRDLGCVANKLRGPARARGRRGDSPPPRVHQCLCLHAGRPRSAHALCVHSGELGSRRESRAG